MHVFVYHTVKLFLDTGSHRKRSSWPHVIHMPQVINAVSSRINQNSVQKQKIMPQEMDIAPRTMSRIIKQDLGFGDFKCQTGQC